MVGYIERISDQVAALIVKNGLDYLQTKAVFKEARRKANLSAPPVGRGAPNRLTLEEELRFIDCAYQKGGQVGLMMQTLLETGARVSEFVALKVEDVSLAERVVIIRAGKGGKRREVPIRDELARLLALHIGKRRRGPLFVSREKGSGETAHVYSRQRVGQIVRTVAQGAGIAKRIYPHLLRHTMATRLLGLGMAITDVQRMLGHEDIGTTRIYAETNAALLRRAFDKVTVPVGRQVVREIDDARGADAAVFAAEVLADRERRLSKGAGA